MKYKTTHTYPKIPSDLGEIPAITGEEVKECVNMIRPPCQQAYPTNTTCFLPWYRVIIGDNVKE